MDSKLVLDKLKDAVDDKRAYDIRVFDVQETSSVSDYVIICHGTSDRQVKAIADEVQEVAEELEIDTHIEGYREGKWVLIDVDDVIVHVFMKTEREYYNLERLFYDGEAIEV